jgi:methyl-accepting chemotaxis protein
LIARTSLHWTDLLEGSVTRSNVAFRAAVAALVEFNLRGGVETSDLATTLEANARSWIISVMAAAALACLLCGVVIIRGVSGPVTSMTSAMRRLADHDMTVEIPGAGRGDEIGGMAAAV